jgi:hypothetical protein
VFWRRGPPAVRSEGRRSSRSSRRFDWATCRGQGSPEKGISTGARSCGGGVNGDSGAPAINVSEGPACELQ